MSKIQEQNNYFFVDHAKELSDINKLVQNIKESEFMDDNTVIVNCSPDYSSMCSLIINHKLSFLNNDELFEMLSLQMPYPIMSQIWNSEDSEFQPYEYYLNNWVHKYLKTNLKYLFLDSGTLRGINFLKLENYVKKRLSKDNYRFASLYLQEDSRFTPDYFVEKFDKDKQGGLLFWWENSNNPNWDY